MKSHEDPAIPSRPCRSARAKASAPTRRRFLERGAGLLAATLLGARSSLRAEALRTPRFAESSSFLDTLRAPDGVDAVTEAGAFALTRTSGRRWEGGGIEVAVGPLEGDAAGEAESHVTLRAPQASVKTLRIRWEGSLAGIRKVLGDHWERSYGDLEWKPPLPEALHPWYVLSFDGGRTHAHGVKTGCGSFAAWSLDERGLNLVLDVRSGGVGVRLGERTLEAASIACRRGEDGESPFEAARSFAKRMCPAPRLADHRVCGTNDWYYTYGSTSSAAEILEDARFVVALSPSPEKVAGNRPYTLIDDGWSQGRDAPGGAWAGSNPKFPSMEGLAADVRRAGARPGIWFRPLLAAKEHAEGMRMKRNRNFLDPTVKDALDQVARDTARLSGWGYELIKHDYSTFDITGLWGKDMAGSVTRDGWEFSNRERTTAEVLLALYRTIRSAAGTARIIGCNTVSHLSAGLFELNRIGDDTSGREWDRTRKMGVNALAFRASQHDAFYAADADCVGWTEANTIPWEKNARWLELLARSGTPLFVSVNRKLVGPTQEKSIREALALGLLEQPIAEPLDWMEDATPRRWRLMGAEHEYDWS